MKEESENKLDQFWNGYCPESELSGKKVRMRLNNWDFYESEETGLQICINVLGVQAVILIFVVPVNLEYQKIMQIML
jgi:hypothetical protein